MLYKPKTGRRRGATVVEAAFVLPVVLFFIIALMLGGLEVFKFQEAYHIARETARFASVHGNQYAIQNATAISAGTLPTVDEAYLIKYAKGKAITLDPSQLQVSVSMTVITPGATAPGTTQTVDWDSTIENQYRSPYSAWTNLDLIPANNVYVDNMVTVQVSYSWTPGYLLGPISPTAASA
jgi:hypothetical protein